MELSLFSRHVPKLKTDAKTILSDMERFNRSVRTAYVLNSRDKDSLKTSKETGKPDLRRKENKHLNTGKSVHMKLKAKFGFNDYFANSANQAAKGVLRSVKELNKRNKASTEEDLKQLAQKQKRTRARLDELLKTKQCLIDRSKYDHHGIGKHRPKLRMPKGSVETWDKKTDTFTIWRYDRRKEERKVVCTYNNAYDFEVSYLDPKIRQLKSRLASLNDREEKLNARLRRMENDPGVCFGSKDFFRKQHTVYAKDHATWKKQFRKRRSRGMTISGRRDSVNGNYVFRYDPDTHTLYYKSMNGTEVCIPDVTFPYGQEWLDDYIRRQVKEKYAPIAWRIEETGGSFLIKCSIHLSDERKNDYCGGGCIGMDVNVDCLAYTEVDRSGNLLQHGIVEFDLSGLSSGQAEQILSRALDKVFAVCKHTHKPLIMERLKDVATTDHYGSKRLNRVLSGFAHTKVTALAVSKSRKYDTAVMFVNPAFTSQIGKVKYMSRYGLSVHEAASMAIARRGMGLKDTVPRGYLITIPADKLPRHHWAHWRFFHKGLKTSPPSMFYRRVKGKPKQMRASPVQRAWAPVSCHS